MKNNKILRFATQKLDVRSMRFSAGGGDKSPTTNAPAQVFVPNKFATLA